eukprot:GILK01004314.1.p1 GENE.GILK01004314.1~~GILK01004314.1.p1  ORF type:complete len:596 (+),score=113.02 GILK01004314.1:38-1789(+)
MSFAPRRALKDVNAKAVAKATEKLPAASKSLKRPVAKSPVTDAKLKKRKIAITDENDNPEATIEAKAGATAMAIPEALKSAAQKLVDLAKVLSSKDTEWVTRNESLNALRTLASENQNPTFWKLLTKHMKKPLSVQLTELRSQVIKEICGTVTYLAMMMRKDFEQLAKYLLPFLAKLVIVAIKVISESAHDCVQAILKHVQSDLCVQFVTTQALTNKSALFRARSGEYYFQILDEWSTETVKANLHSIEQGVMKLLTDSDGAARKNARSAFASLARNFRGRAVKIYRSLDKHVVKLLKEEYSAVVADLSGAAAPAEEEEEELAQEQHEEEIQQEEEVLEEEEQDGGGRECAQDSDTFVMMPSEDCEETLHLPVQVPLPRSKMDSQATAQIDVGDQINNSSSSNNGVINDENSTGISTPNRKSPPLVDAMNSVERMLCDQSMNHQPSLFDSPLDLTRDEPYQFEFSESKSMPKMDLNDSMETVEVNDVVVSQQMCEPCTVSVSADVVDTNCSAVESTGSESAQGQMEVVHTLSGPCLCCVEKDEMIASLQDQLLKMANTVKYFGIMEGISKYTIADLESRLQKE